MARPSGESCDVARAKLSVVPVLLAALLLAGCSSTSKTRQDRAWSPNRSTPRPKDELNSGAYDKADPLFEKLEGRAAGTPLAQQAQLERAYAYYKAGDQAQAHATLDRFIKLHPASPALDYALYLKGIVNFNDNLGLFSFMSRAGPVRARPEGRPRNPSSRSRSW
jgi:outer membrane protein assembly factor BamD